MYPCFIGCMVSDKHKARFPYLKWWFGIFEVCWGLDFLFPGTYNIYIYQNPPVGSEIWAPQKNPTQKQKTDRLGLKFATQNGRVGRQHRYSTNSLLECESTGSVGRIKHVEIQLSFFMDEILDHLGCGFFSPMKNIGAYLCELVHDFFYQSYVEMWHPTAVITDHARWPMTGVLSLSAWCCHWFHQTLSSTEWRRLAQILRWRLDWNIYSIKKPSPFFHLFGCNGVTSLECKILYPRSNATEWGPETPPWKGFRELSIEMEVFLHCYMFWSVSQIIIYWFIFCSSGTQSIKIFCSQGSPRTPCRRFLGGYCIWMSMKGGILHRNYIRSYGWCTNPP